MKITLSTNEAADRLFADEYAGWSRAGAFALAEWLEEYETDVGEELELDVVGVRCDFSEWESLEDFGKGYFSSVDQMREAIGADDSELEPEEIEELLRDWIEGNGVLIEFDGGVIVSSF